MNQTRKTKEQLVNELAEARARIAELEVSETECEKTAAEAQRQAAQFALIYKVGQRVSGELELGALFAEIVTAVRDVFDYYGVMLLLLDEDAKHLTLQSAVGNLAGVFSEGLRLAVGEGMIGYAAETGKVQISGDVNQDPHYVRVADERTQSELVAPIKSGQRVIGVLDLQSNKFDAFDESTVMMMEILANQVAVAIENARLFEEAQQRLQEQTMLINVSRTLASAPLQPEGIAEIVARQFVEVMGVSECSLSLLNDQRDALRIVVSVFTDEERKTFYQEYGPEVDYLADYPSTAHAIETLQPLMVHASDPDADPAELAYMREFGVVTEVLIPMVVKGQVIGIIEFEEYDQERHFSEEEIDLAMTLGSQAAAAMENARLYETVQRAYTEVEKQVEKRTAALMREMAERKRLEGEQERLKREVIEAQRRALL